MTPARLAFCLVFLALAGCQSLIGRLKGKEEVNALPKEKSDSSYRQRDTRPPELFPAEFIVPGVRPQPEVRKEDIRPAGARERLATIDPPVVPPPPLLADDAARLSNPLPESRDPVADALHCILRGKHKEALGHLQGYDQATQELLLRILPLLAQIHEKGLDRLGPAEVAVLHEQLQSLLSTLRPRTELTIDKMCFCEWVKEYGVYKPLAEGHVFHASAPHQPGDLVQLYAELRNFTSELRGDFFETRLASSVEIHDPRDSTNTKLWYYRFDTKKELLRSRALLNDYFGNYNFHVPHLPAGTYVLTLQIADETRPEQRRVARKSIEFRVTSPAR